VDRFRIEREFSRGLFAELRVSQGVRAPVLKIAKFASRVPYVKARSAKARRRRSPTSVRTIDRSIDFAIGRQNRRISPRANRTRALFQSSSPRRIGSEIYSAAAIRFLRNPMTWCERLARIFLSLSLSLSLSRARARRGTGQINRGSRGLRPTAEFRDLMRWFACVRANEFEI
jgi:hypothetical protein